MDFAGGQISPRSRRDERLILWAGAFTAVAVQKGFKKFIHHTEVIVSFELVFDVHEVAVERIDAAGEELANVKRGGWGAVEKLARILDYVKRTRLQRAHGRGMRSPQQHRHFAEDSARLRSGSHAHVVLQDFDLAFDQEIESFRLFTLLNDVLAGIEPDHRTIPKQFKD
jgi:hypothetical protein